MDTHLIRLDEAILMSTHNIFCMQKIENYPRINANSPPVDMILQL